MTEDQAYELIELLMENCSIKQEINPEKIAEFYLDLDYGEAIKSVRNYLIADGKYFPSHSAIRLPIFESRIPITAEAWREVLGYVRSAREGVLPVFSHPLIGKTVGIISWDRLRKTDVMSFEEKRFQQLYGELRTAEVKRLNLESLEGKNNANAI